MHEQRQGEEQPQPLHAVLYDNYLRYQMLVLTYRGAEAVDEHKEMFEAALARDVEQASKALERHITRGLEHTIAAFNKTR